MSRISVLFCLNERRPNKKKIGYKFRGNDYHFKNFNVKADISP